MCGLSNNLDQNRCKGPTNIPTSLIFARPDAIFLLQKSTNDKLQFFLFSYIFSTTKPIMPRDGYLPYILTALPLFCLPALRTPERLPIPITHLLQRLSNFFLDTILHDHRHGSISKETIKAGPCPACIRYLILSSLFPFPDSPIARRGQGCQPLARPEQSPRSRPSRRTPDRPSRMF